MRGTRVRGYNGYEGTRVRGNEYICRDMIYNLCLCFSFIFYFLLKPKDEKNDLNNSDDNWLPHLYARMHVWEVGEDEEEEGRRGVERRGVGR